MDPDILKRFEQWWARARRQGLQEPDAAILSTVDARGRPTARTVLIRSCSPEGFVFYTNLRSRKGQHLQRAPYAALTFYWMPLGLQVLAEGPAERVTEDEADTYWATRPRQSQLGAWASEQSAPLASRWVLLKRYAALARRFAGRPVPRPLHWSGFRVRPDRVEFWRARPFRLHERICYERQGARWIRRLLNP
jgi:pyridoxamine 5'-phosphate oxidase